jgi:hypothetical protein
MFCLCLYLSKRVKAVLLLFYRHCSKFGSKHVNKFFIVFASSRKKNEKEKVLNVFILINELSSAQFFITIFIEFVDHLNGTLLWITITFTIGFTYEIILKRKCPSSKINCDKKESFFYTIAKIKLANSS